MRLLAVLISLVLTLDLSAQLQRVDVKAIDRVMASTMRAFDIPGAALVIVRNDSVLHVAGYGTKALGSSEAVGPDTLFQIASTSKAFTSAALAMLVSEGKVSWDDAVRKHVGYFRLSDLCADSQVTVRDLLSHRTGVSRHDELWDNTPLTREQVIRGMGDLELARPFRGGYGYQNMMYIAAGEVVSGASGMPWDDFVLTRLFKPLGMSSTTVRDDEWEASDHAIGHRFLWKTGQTVAQKQIETATLGAAGAIKTTARDMGNWLRFQLADGTFEGTSLVDPVQLAETKTPHTVIRLENASRDANPESLLQSYGLGWVIQDYRGELLVSHAGALNGFRTHVDLLPKRNLGFAVMVNTSRGYAVIALRNALIDVLTRKGGRDWKTYYLRVERKEDEKEELEKQERLAGRTPDSRPTKPLASYAGEYRSVSHGNATISVDGGKLILGWNRMNVPLTHFHFDVFNAEVPEEEIDEQVSFDLDAGQQVTSMTIWGTRFLKVKPTNTVLER